ncbi:DUF3649 domain-containing protein [Pseudomonas sp. CFBP 13710]|uniref:DUF3649 domain-containing protein n=1 Tax=Pseudomonas sp. CFBP 13710 TaxID=2775311 RepID=UPI0017869D3E|nr:DUF3649 domain-containing protein [Pseudomonas sp. CFBP 13710]MBD8731348.1 DUF3649 domain-containing protein [Pseudomonas sp. CFBP 13710]
MRSRIGGVPASYRWAVASRIVAAVFGGYVLAALASVCIAWLLPMARGEAVVSAMMLSFLVYLVAVLWCFASHSAGRAWLGLAIPGLILAAITGLLHWQHLP